MVKGAAGPGVYSATYSGIPVWEFQFGVDLKEHVMRRRHDDWINATHILKAAGFDKPARTRILEREVQKDVHEKVQGGYGKYQGTWIPLDHGEALASRNNTYDRLRPIFEFTPGNESPPPAPRHTSKPKQPKKPAVPKWNVEYDHGDTEMHEDDTPDNLTVASASYMAEDDRQDGSHFGTGHRKRKREDMIQDMTEQQHAVYGDELLDYFILAQNAQPAIRPDPPTNFQPNWPIDVQSHTALHWAAAMADVDVIKQLKRFGASLTVQNSRGETPFMRAVNFTNGYEKQTFPAVMKELFDTIDLRDLTGCTVIHHAAVMKSGAINSPSVARYYLDNILNRLQESHDRQFAQKLVDAQDLDGNTAIHLAAQRGASKCIRALLGRGASTDIPNREGVCAEDLIRELNATKKPRTGTAGGTARSSSPFAPESGRHAAYRDALTDPPKLLPAFESDAATTVASRITPLVSEKFAALAASYEDEWKEKSAAEKDARVALASAQAGLAGVRAGVAELETQLEQDETAAAKLVSEAALAQTQVLGMVTHRNRIAVQAAVDAELAVVMANGDEAGEPDERLRLAGDLRGLLLQQRLAEADYVSAMSQVGTGDKIDRYRRLLKSCLGPEAESLEDNVDDILAMMEEEATSDGRGAGAVAAMEGIA